MKASDALKADAFAWKEGPRTRKTFKLPTALGMLLGLAAVTAMAKPPLPVAFETHQGPADSQVRFTAHSQAVSLALLDDGSAVLS